MNGQTRTGVHNGKDEPEYLTGQEVAMMLQVSVKTIWRWVKLDPTMPALTFGHTVRFHRIRLLAWLKTREQGAGRGKRLQEPLHLHSKQTEKLEQSLTVSSPCARA